MTNPADPGPHSEARHEPEKGDKGEKGAKGEKGDEGSVGKAVLAGAAAAGAATLAAKALSKDDEPETVERDDDIVAGNDKPHIA